MKVLLIQTAFIGDLILTTPLIREIFKKYNQPEVTIIINKGTEKILENNPYVKNCISFDKKLVKKSISYFFKFLSEIRSYKFDICIAAHFSHRSSLISYFSNAKERIGYIESGFAFLHTTKVQRPIHEVHEVEKLFSLIHPVKTQYPKIRRPELFPIEEHKNYIQNLLENSNILNNEFIIIAPSSLWETKKYPLVKFKELAKLVLSNTSFKIVLIGSKNDFELCEEIKKDLSENIFNFSGKTDFLQLSYLISKSKAVISNDSSPIHFASANNTPTVAIFGATLPSFGYTPLSDKFIISEIKNLYCRSCGIHGGNICPEKHFRCMNDQTPESIFNLFQKLIA